MSRLYFLLISSEKLVTFKYLSPKVYRQKVRPLHYYSWVVNVSNPSSQFDLSIQIQDHITPQRFVTTMKIMTCRLALLPAVCSVSPLFLIAGLKTWKWNKVPGDTWPCWCFYQFENLKKKITFPKRHTEVHLMKDKVLGDYKIHPLLTPITW